MRDEVGEATAPVGPATPAELREEAANVTAEALDALQALLHLHVHLADYGRVEHFARIAKELEAGPPKPIPPPTNWQEVFWKLGQVIMRIVPNSVFSSVAQMAGGYEPFVGALLSQLSADTLRKLSELSDDEMEAKIRQVMPGLPADAAEEVIQAVRAAAAEPSLPGNSVPTGRE